MLLIRFIDLFTFPMTATRINKGGMSLDVALQRLDVAMHAVL